jgi:hypothetical protein
MAIDFVEVLMIRDIVNALNTLITLSVLIIMITKTENLESETNIKQKFILILFIFYINYIF